MKKHPQLPKRPCPDGFTFVELLVAMVVAALLITAAVIGFSTLSQAPTRSGRVDVSLAPGIFTNFYGPTFSGSYVTMALNPNYFQGVEARRMKDRLLADVSSATAVFSLGRNAQLSPADRPAQLEVPANTDFRTNATPTAFRNFLTNTTNAPAFSNAASVFFGTEGSGLTNALPTNCSIFILGGLDSPVTATNTKLNILATYEMDFVPTTTPSGGTYASVRRYAGTNPAPTDFYHVFFPDESNTTNGFRPLAAFFGRGTAGTNVFVLGNNHPFTFVWWPDPLASSLSNRFGVSVPVPSSAVARSNYVNMGGRTTLFFVLPTFPGL